MIQRRRALLTSAFLLMLAAAFIDNLRGSLIPLLHDHLELDFALAGAMLLTVAGISGGLFNSQLLNIERRTGVRGLIIFSVGLTVILLSLRYLSILGRSFASISFVYSARSDSCFLRSKALIGF
ncbi:MAG: hypothetical protein EBU49_07785 [Proteobacteria bacterium]|nr:hypothetical protein [Pseudomonadota bacterium]